MRIRPTRLLPFVLAFALGIGAAVLTACGSSTNQALIPAANADQLKSDLDAVQAAIDLGQCDKIQHALDQARTDVAQLPSHVSVRLVNRINEGIRQLEIQAPRACTANTTTTQTQATTTTVLPATTATTAPPATTPSTPATTPTTPTTTPSTPTTTPSTPTTTPSDTGGVTTP